MTRTAEIEIEMVKTCDPDAQPLDYLFQYSEYHEQDQARLKAWRDDEWHFVGIRAPRPPSKSPTAATRNAGSPPNCCRPACGASRAIATSSISNKSIRTNGTFWLAMLATLKTCQLTA